MTENTTTFPTWISILGGDAACGRCPDSHQRDLSADNLLDHLNDPALAHRHGDWANPTPAQNQARELAYGIDWPGTYGPRPAEVVADAIVPLIEELHRLRAQQTEGADNTATLSSTPVAPDTEVEVVPTTVTLTCPLCVNAQSKDTDHIEEVTAPTHEAARKLLVDHILNTDDDVAHDDVNVVEYLVKHHA